MIILIFLTLYNENSLESFPCSNNSSKVKPLFGFLIHIMRTDNAKNILFSIIDLMSHSDIIHRPSYSYIPHQNRIAENKIEIYSTFHVKCSFIWKCLNFEICNFYGLLSYKSHPSLQLGDQIPYSLSYPSINPCPLPSRIFEVCVLCMINIRKTLNWIQKLVSYFLRSLKLKKPANVVVLIQINFSSLQLLLPSLSLSFILIMSHPH